MVIEANELLLKKIIGDPVGKQVFDRVASDCDEVEIRKLYEKLFFEEGKIEEERRDFVINAHVLLNREWPKPRWAIPDLLPMGFTIIAGAPKVGKSWLALQLAYAVSTGGIILQTKVEQGNVLYLALEDSPRRLKDRMRKQGWNDGLNCDFVVMGDFEEWLGKLDEKGMEKFGNFLGRRDYRLIVIDTLSRAVRGDQNEVEEMTSNLAPLQMLAHRLNCAVVIVDHHKKTGSAWGEIDVVGDILGSTAKGALADTAVGLYRERGKAGARLAIVGKEVEDKVLQVSFCSAKGVWEVDEEEMLGLTQQQLEILNVMENLRGAAGPTMIAEEVGRNKGSVSRQLVELERMGKIQKVDGKKYVLRENLLAEEE
jgi:predicted transcriptional regulator/archaellum biogenesis ATPase FlaH